MIKKSDLALSIASVMGAPLEVPVEEVSNNDEHNSTKKMIVNVGSLSADQKLEAAEALLVEFMCRIGVITEDNKLTLTPEEMAHRGSWHYQREDNGNGDALAFFAWDGEPRIIFVHD